MVLLTLASPNAASAYTFTRLTVKPRNVTLLMFSLPVGMPSLLWRALSRLGPGRWVVDVAIIPRSGSGA